jgi:membrane-associated phospholipid phosphatase
MHTSIQTMQASFSCSLLFFRKPSWLILLLIGYGLNYAQNADITLLRKINVHRNSKLDNSFRFLTHTVTPVSLALPFSMIGAGLHNNDKVLVRQGFVSGASLVLATGISVSLKYSIRRKRPFVVYDDIQKMTSAGPCSFPSGHTTAAFATATSLSLAFPKWYVVAPSYLWAAAVAYSRMHLGVHFPSDVIAGILIGAGSSLLCYEAQGWVKK